MTSKLPFLAATAALAGLSPLSAQQGQGGESVAVTASGIDSLKIDGQLRYRVDQRDPMTPVKGALSDSTQFARFRIGFGAQLDEQASAYLQLQNTITTIGDGQGMATTASVHQAYGRLDDLYEGINAQIGRFEMSFGNQRMVSPLDWSDAGRAWDGLLVNRAGESYSIDLFTTQPVAGQAAPVGVTNQEFAGVYFEYDFGQFDLDLYGFHRRMGIGFADDTYGFLLEGDYAELGLGWEIEYAMQTGDHGALDAAGTAFALGVDYDLEGLKVGAGYEFASGADGKDDRFVPLYHFAHAYNGHQDIVTWSNLQDIVLRAAYPVGDDWRLHGDVHFLSRAEDKDAVQFGMGAPGATSNAKDSDIGTEVDLYLKGEWSENVDIWTGVSQFMAGDAIVGGDDQLWIFFQIGFSF